MLVFIDRVHKIWPGPCRLKTKRCTLLATGIVVAFILVMLSIHLPGEIFTNINERPFLMDGTDYENTPIDWPKMDTLNVVARVESKGVLEDDTSKPEQKFNSESALSLQLIDNEEVDQAALRSERFSKLISETVLIKTKPVNMLPVRTKPLARKQKTVFDVPAYWNSVRVYNFKTSNKVNVADGGLKKDTGKPNHDQKHLFILGHYEQLGKTTINFFEAAKLAYLTKRKIVKPFARGSRFCGLKSGWTGSLLAGSRSFKPLDLYYNVTAMEEIFENSNLAEMEYLDTFKKSCSFKKTGRKIVIIYFFYSSNEHKYLSLTEQELKRVKSLLKQSKGWIDCSFINKRIKIDERIGDDIKAGQQYCVDPEVLTDVNIFEKRVLKSSPCVVINQWQGTGPQRTHFNLTIVPSPEKLLMSLQPSDFVISEVMRTLSLVGPNFIGIHIRSERQLLWHGLDRWIRCMNLVYQETRKLKTFKKVKVFISGDIGQFGSDQIPANFNKTVLKMIYEKYDRLVKGLNAISYSVVRPKHQLWTDSGLVALIQANILSLAKNLVTLGAGTFQKWIKDKFKARKALINDKSWTITKVCFAESKAGMIFHSSKKPTRG